MLSPAAHTALTASAATLAVAGLAAGAWCYSAMWPTSQLFGPTLIAGRDPRQIALTFDDGPNLQATPQLLEVLARHQVRATFFFIGRFVREAPALAREVAAAGHLIGGHTMTHPLLATRSAATIRRELADSKAVIEDVIGAPIHFFRPPFGARRPIVLRTARELGLYPVQWNVTGRDWNPLPPARIAATVLGGIAANQRRGRGSNVLLHDGGHTRMGVDRLPTVRATGQVLATLAATPAAFVTPEAWT